MTLFSTPVSDEPSSEALWKCVRQNSLRPLLSFPSHYLTSHTEVVGEASVSLLGRVNLSCQNSPNNIVANPVHILGILKIVSYTNS